MSALQARLCTALLTSFVFASVPSLRAQGSDPRALTVVRAAVAAELTAGKTDKSNWMYRDHDTQPDKNAIYKTVETPQGMLRRMIELNGNPLTASAENKETQRINEYVHDSSAQAKDKRNAAHDDRQAAEMLQMLPKAFIWTVAGEDNEAVTLNYRPDPNFDAPDMQSRVMSQMAGQMIVTREGSRVRSFRGKLADDVKIGWGLLGKLNEGGSFDVERREIAPGHWQITETHVHIGGHALIFKTIGQQEDEVKTEWVPSPATTLEQAAKALGAGQ